MYHLQGFQVIAANLVGNIAGAAGGAFIHDVHHPVSIGALAVEEGQGHGEPAARGVTQEIIIGDAGAAFGKPPALDMVKRNPFTVGALTASLHIGFIVF
jgi:hypothetical protein